ncbi:MAG: TonB-dependent receptor plug domain-containing protein [Byssovorax sp.]
MPTRPTSSADLRGARRASFRPGRRGIAARALAALVILSTVALAGRAVAAPPVAASAVVAPRIDPPPQVAYPPGASGDAEVTLILTIDKEGSVRLAEVADGAEPFASAAKQAALSWHFQPATRDGVPVGAKIRFAATFHGAVTAPAPIEPEPEPTPPVAVVPLAGDRHPPIKAPPPKAPIEIVIRADKLPPSVTSLSRAEVRQLPGTFGDPFRAIEILPGVTPIVSGLPFFYIRGAPPGNVGYFLDGVRVPYLFHVAIGPSIVNPALVERVDLYSGGYPAQFGRYAGAIVSAETTAPRDDFHGEGNLRIFDAGAMVESGFGDGRGTALVGGRYSYTGALFSLISPTLTLDYRDYQARFTWNLTSRDQVGLFAFGAYDLLAQEKNGIQTIVFGSEFYRFDLRLDHRFLGGGHLRWAATGGFDQTRIAGGQQNARDVPIGTRVELTQPLTPEVTLRAGIDAQFDSYSADPQRFGDPQDPDTKSFNALFPPRNDAALAGRADLVVKLGRRVELTPGMRVDLFRSGGASAVSADGRVALRAEITDKIRLVHAVGIAHQPPSFIIPLPGVAVGSLQGGLQTSVQSSAGIELDLPDATTATVSLFDNVFLDMSDTLGVARPRTATRSEPRSLGSAYGLEVYVRRRLTRRLGGFVSYTLSRSNRSEGKLTFPSAFDRTHVLNLAAAFDIGRGWRAGARFTFYTGAPALAGQLAAAATGDQSMASQRDPAFYRIDLRLEKRWTLSKARWISFVAEMLNTTLHKEIVSGQEIGPIAIPSLGVEGGF